MWKTAEKKCWKTAETSLLENDRNILGCWKMAETQLLENGQNFGCFLQQSPQKLLMVCFLPFSNNVGGLACDSGERCSGLSSRFGAYLVIRVNNVQGLARGSGERCLGLSL